MKYLYIVIVFFLISCKNDENVKVVNQNLVLEIKSFIKKIDKNFPCSSDFITIRIDQNEIRMGNYKPKLTKDFIGKSKFDKSEIYFFCSGDYSDYVLITNKISSDMKNDIKPENSCDPPMYRILIIDKKDRNKFHYPPPPNLKNVK